MGIGIGLVGLGSFGSAFADLFKKHPLVSRVGLCDTEAARYVATGVMAHQSCLRDGEVLAVPDWGDAPA